VDTYSDEYKIRFFENKIPSQFRSKQNVSLNGQQTDQ